VPARSATGPAPIFRPVTASPYRDPAILYPIRRSNRARHVRIEVDRDGVRVIVPRRMPLREVAPFVAAKRPWIERTLRRHREAAARDPAVRLVDGGSVPYLGRELELRLRVEPGRVRPHVAMRGDRLHVAVGRPGAAALRDALERWYRRRARIEVAARLDAAARALPLKHVIDGLRAAIVTGSGIGHHVGALLALVAWSIGGVTLAVRFFRWE